MTITDIAPHIHARNTAAIVIYTKPNCVQCTRTFRMLDRAEIVYTAVNVTEDQAALDYIKGLDYSSAPVVFVSTIEGEIHWGGFRPDLIEQHITHVDAA